ncbi:CotH kinase family protein [Actinoplanes sp. NPDC051851]|uniref:CotH kinase family protein n=1 Tax=Actinoplanes sp. NPDC051851 TaxID=3154753 RepID=UPI003415A829
MSRRAFGTALAGVFGVAVFAGCGSSSDAASSGSTTGGDDSGGLFDTSKVHDVELTFDTDDYSEMLSKYLDGGDKEWIETAVTIDGTAYQKAGLRFKGNSSLRGVSTSSDPKDLPWLVRLDKYVDGQTHDGYNEFVIRSSNTSTALNEAVALELLGMAGLATQKSFSTRFTVNGGSAVLRLAIENPDDTWDAENFSSAGLLYKAEANGDYSYRGDDASSYDDVFDQEAGDDDLTPLIAFLKFINQSSDTDFGTDLKKYLDVEAFATYLAFEDMISNSDDIDGPGNNSYLRYTTDSKVMTVVAWDHNLAFGGMGGGGGGGNNAGGGGMPSGGTRPSGGAMPSGAAMPSGGGQMPQNGGGGKGGGGGPGGKSNILVTRFKANTTFAAAYTKAGTDLKSGLYTSGKAAAVLKARAAVLTAQASDLVSTDTITSETSKIEAYFS